MEPIWPHYMPRFTDVKFLGVEQRLELQVGVDVFALPACFQPCFIDANTVMTKATDIRFG